MNKLKKPIAIFIIGRPGAGKDTQAELLAARFNLEHIITSDLIQRKFKDSLGDPQAKQEKKFFDKGILNTPEWVAGLIKEHAQELARNNFNGKNGIIFSGSPRTQFEVENLTPALKDIFGGKHLFAIYLDISENEGTKRILKRGARALDRDPQKLKVRMREYGARTQPVLEYFDNMGILKRVDGMPAAAVVAQRINDFLDKKL